MKITFLTAGAAGMYCGSCMHDNALSRALRSLGCDCLLQPLYTPIRTDEPNIAASPVFFGGVHIYLLQKMPWLRLIPSSIRRLLDKPRFLSWATTGAAAVDASALGELAVSMLRGENGRQREEVGRIVEWLRDEIQPDVVLFSNLLIGGCIPAIRRDLPKAKIVAILQGDDSFLDHLPPAMRAAAVIELRRLARLCDAIIVNSDFYRKKMSELLELPASLVHCFPLSIDAAPYRDFSPPIDRQPVTIGYLARIAPEKGLHHLIDAFIELAKRPGCEEVKLCAAGWLGEQNRTYKNSLDQIIENAGLGLRYQYLGSPDLAGKVAMLQGIDLLCVPTVHEEPKGLFVLEAMASGIPVVLPRIGAFPEMIDATGGGLLVPAADKLALTDALEKLVKDSALRSQLGQSGRRSILATRTTAIQAKALLAFLDQI